MKNWLIFGGGFLAGVVVTVLVLVIIGLANQNNGGLLGATYFDEPSKEIKENSFEVMQVIQDHAALVRSKESPSSSLYLGPIYLMVNNSGRYYYDDEIIDVPRNLKVVQIGIYKYSTKMGVDKTVPIIGLTDR